MALLCFSQIMLFNQIQNLMQYFLWYASSMFNYLFVLHFPSLYIMPYCISKSDHNAQMKNRRKMAVIIEGFSQLCPCPEHTEKKYRLRQVAEGSAKICPSHLETSNQDIKKRLDCMSCIVYHRVGHMHYTLRFKMMHDTATSQLFPSGQALAEVTKMTNHCLSSDLLLGMD